MNNDKKMLFEAMHKVAGMPLNEEGTWQNVDQQNYEPTPSMEKSSPHDEWLQGQASSLEQLSTRFYEDQDKLLKNVAHQIISQIDNERISSEEGVTSFDEFLVSANIGGDAKERMMTHYMKGYSTGMNEEGDGDATVGGGEKFRAEVTGKGENRWSGNAMEYDTEEEAKEWLDNLASRWFGFDMSRVVPVSMPTGQPLDMENDIIYQNLRG
jgi:hypothetical protein